MAVRQGAAALRSILHPEPRTLPAQDLQKGDARLFAKARKHYEALGDRLTAAGAALDVFACSLDQVGLAEMRPAVSDSGGKAE